MQLKIKFSNILAERLGKTIVLDVPANQLTSKDLMSIIEKQEWADEVLENGHIKVPIVLIIDNQLIQASNSIDDLVITESSEITFQVMFAGGR